MRNLVWGCLLAGALGIASYAAISASPSDRPPDVEAKDWIAMGPSWGFVVESVSSGGTSGGRVAASPESQPGQPRAIAISPTALYTEADPRLVPRTLNGFFVVKRDGAWARIAAIPTP